MTEYNEEEFLALSGIQHFVFCKRQWGLIHIEQQWQDNVHTVEGNILHDRVHDQFLYETRNGIRTVRGVAVHSRQLGVYGICDIVEFHKDESIIPVEYKKGSPKESSVDIMQLTLQAICLEEMMCKTINYAYIYYGETRHRLKVEITNELREQAENYVNQMHDYFNRQHTPKVKPSKSCQACSLRDLCIPKLCSKRSARQYIKESLEEINI